MSKEVEIDTLRNATRFNLDSIIEDRKLSFDEWLVYEALNKRNKVRKRER